MATATNTAAARASVSSTTGSTKFFWISLQVAIFYQSILPVQSFSSPSSISFKLLSTTTRPSEKGQERLQTGLYSGTKQPPSSSSSSSSKPPPPSNVQYVDFWGTKISKLEDNGGRSSIDTGDDDAELRAYFERLEAPLPSLYSLDKDGPLPPGSYTRHSSSQSTSSSVLSSSGFESKRTCRLSLAIQSPSTMGDGGSSSTTSNDSGSTSYEALDTQVQQLQRCVDSGFQTFQFDNNHSVNWELIERFHSQTPSYVDSHWVVPFPLEDFAIQQQVGTVENQLVPILSSISTKDVRQSVLEYLNRMGTNDAIDTLMVPYLDSAKNSPVQDPRHPAMDSHSCQYYHLDILDILMDLQRDGYIRSIGLESWPVEARTKALYDYSFPIDTIQQSGNLILPPPSFMPPRSKAQNSHLYNEWWTNPLANELLSSHPHTLSNERRFRGQYPSFSKVPLPLPDYSSSQRNMVWKTLRNWAKLHLDIQNDDSSDYSPEYLWQIFQDKVLSGLQYTALKHQVSVPAVALRWALQQQQQQQQQDSSFAKAADNGGTKNQRIAPCSSTVAPLRLMANLEDDHSSNPYALSKYLKDYRDVFRFELDDEEDLPSLQSMMSLPKTQASSLQKQQSDYGLPEELIDEYHKEELPPSVLRELEEELQRLRSQQDEEERAAMGTDDEDYPEIDFSNTDLWL